MPSVFSHAIVGSTLVACGLPRPRATLVALGAVLAVVPDLDVVGIAFGWGLDHPLGHRGLSHSVLAAVTLAGLVHARDPRPPAGAPLAHLAGPGPGGGVARPARCADQRRARRRVPGAVRRHALALPGATDRGLADRRVVVLLAPRPRGADQRGRVAVGAVPGRAGARRGRCAGSAIHERPQLARPVADLRVLHGAIEQRTRSRRLAAADQVERGVVGRQRRLPFGRADRRLGLRLLLGPGGLVDGVAGREPRFRLRARDVGAVAAFPPPRRPRRRRATAPRCCAGGRGTTRPRSWRR